MKTSQAIANSGGYGILGRWGTGRTTYDKHLPKFRCVENSKVFT